MQQLPGGSPCFICEAPFITWHQRFNLWTFPSRRRLCPAMSPPEQFAFNPLTQRQHENKSRTDHIYSYGDFSTLVCVGSPCMEWFTPSSHQTIISSFGFSSMLSWGFFFWGGGVPAHLSHFMSRWCWSCVLSWLDFCITSAQTVAMAASWNNSYRVAALFTIAMIDGSWSRLLNGKAAYSVPPQ